MSTLPTPIRPEHTVQSRPHPDPYIARWPLKLQITQHSGADARIPDPGYYSYRPHSLYPLPTPSPIGPNVLPFRRSSNPFDAGYRGGHDPPSIQHDFRHSPHVSPGLGLAYPFPELPYHPYPGPLTQPQPLPPSASLSMHKLCQTSPVPAVPAMNTLTSFHSRPPVFLSLHCNTSAPYSETDPYRVPSFEPDSIHWNSPPTSSGLPVTPPDHIAAPQLPSSSHLPPPPPPPPHYVPAHILPLPFSPDRTRPAFSTSKDERIYEDTQASLKPKTSLNEGTKDVFQSLKRKRLPVAASFSRPKPRTLPIKKVLPKIHGCPTCGKMFDRPSTLLVHQASHTKAKDYACNKCRKTFSVNSNMRRHWRNCTETPKDYSVPSSPSVPIKQELLSSPSEPSEPRFAESPSMPGPAGPSRVPRSLSDVPAQHTVPAGVSPITLPPPPPKMAWQPPSLRGRFYTVSEPEIATPVRPVQPRMTNAQEQEMKGWFLQDIWRDIMGRLKSWRSRRLVGARSPLAAIDSSTATLVNDEDFEGDANAAKKRWGEERDSWLNTGYAPYFGAQWNGVLPGPGPEDLSAVPTSIVNGDEETVRDIP